MHNFEHQAMATRFLISMTEVDTDYAQNVAQRCFQRLDELEHFLSRFVADSDVSRINKLHADSQLALEHETWEVIKQAIKVQQWTQGTFDIGVAEHMNIFRAAKEGILNEFEMNKALIKAQEEKSKASLYVDPEKPYFYCIQPGMYFDLGGIGKGYALDQLSLLLHDMEIENYYISAGESTILTKGSPKEGEKWTHSLSASEEHKTITLDAIAVSASGTFHQGNHIFDPRTGKNSGVSEFDRIWVASKKAAYSDAFATGFFLQSVKEIENIVKNIQEIAWVAYSKDGKLFSID